MGIKRTTLQPTPNMLSLALGGNVRGYNGEVIAPRYKKNICEYPSGFVVGGIIKWSESVADRFKYFGGDLLLNTKVEEILIENSKVTGVMINQKEIGRKEIKAPIVVSNVPSLRRIAFK